MLISDKGAIARLDSPMNLMNKLRQTSNPRKSAMSLFIRPSVEKIEDKEIEDIKISFNPFQKLSIEPLPTPEIQTPPTKLDDILKNNESQIKLGLAHERSLNLLSRSVHILASKLDDVRDDKRASVITVASELAESLRKERSEGATQ